MFPAIKAAFTKSGIASNIHTTMRDGPVGDLGAGLIYSFHSIGTSRTTYVVEQIN